MDTSAASADKSFALVVAVIAAVLMGPSIVVWLVAEVIRLMIDRYS